MTSATNIIQQTHLPGLHRSYLRTGAVAIRKDATGAFHLSSAPNRDSARNYTAYSLTANSTSRSFTLDEQIYNGTITTPPTFKFVGLSTEDDGTAEFFDADQNGILDGPGFAISCNSVKPKRFWIIMDPPQRQKIYSFAENNAPPGWSIIPPNLVWYGASCANAGTTVSPEIIAVSQGIQKNLTVDYNVTQ